MHTTEQLDANKDDPPASGRFGPPAFHATAPWPREAFADPRFEVHEAIARDDLGTAPRLGWVPPSPWYLSRSALATRRALARLRRNPDTCLEP